MNRPWSRIALTLTAATLGLAGCMVGPNYHAPDERGAMPGKFAEATRPPVAVADATQPATQAATLESPEPQVVDLARWWDSFHDPELTSLIVRAAANNWTVKQAEARIRQERALWGIEAAGLFPEVGVNGEYVHSRSNNGTIVTGNTTGASTGNTTVGNTTGGSTTGGNTSGSTGSTGSTGSGSTGAGATETTTGVGTSGPVHDLYQVGFDASWELDIFGGQRRAIEAAQYNIDSAVEDRRYTLITLLAEVATDYINLRGAQEQLAVTQRDLKAFQDVLDLTQSQFKAGLTNELTVEQQQAQVESTAAQIPALEETINISIYEIGTLLGVAPESLLAELQPSAPTPLGPPVVPPGLPLELLRRRPDVREAERNLAAATANIGVAISQLYPQFAINGDIGIEASQFKGLGNWNNRYYSLGPSVSWPILDFGRLRANVDQQNALQEQAFDAYQQAVLQSLQDVETALVSYTREQTRHVYLQRAVDADQRAVDLANDLYQKGLTDFINVLTTEQTLFIAQDTLIQSRTTVSTNLVALYKALGGGWEIGEGKPASDKTSNPATQPAPWTETPDPESTQGPPAPATQPVALATPRD